MRLSVRHGWSSGHGYRIVSIYGARGGRCGRVSSSLVQLLFGGGSLNYKLEIKTLTCTTHATPHPTDHLTGLPRIRVANMMLTPKTKPREIARVYYKTNKCSSSAEIERSRVSLASRGWAARSRRPDDQEQPSASDGGRNEKVSRGSGEGCNTHLEGSSKSP